MVSAKVEVRRWGPEFAKRINDEVRDALGPASEVGAKVASEAVTRRRTGRMANIEAVPVKGTSEGWQAGFKSEAFYSHMQSRGTKKGITPLGHEEKGLKAAKADLIARINALT